MRHKMEDVQKVAEAIKDSQGDFSVGAETYSEEWKYYMVESIAALDAMRPEETEPRAPLEALIKDQMSRITELEAQLSTAQADALREAARVYRTGKDWEVFATADCAILDLIQETG